MSGVEAVGLVLGVVPLLISALEYYIEGVNTIQRWWRYERQLANLGRILYAEHVRFLGTCERLLQDLVPPADLENLIQHPFGPQWKDHELEQKLERRLHRSYTPYSQSMGDMVDAVRELQALLKVDSDWKALNTCDATSFKRKFRAIKFSLSHRQIHELIERVEKNNDILANLTSQNIELEPLRMRQRRPMGVHFKAIQEHARNLYSVISSGWTCECPVPHNANLRLEPRLSDPSMSFGNKVGQFRVVFSTDSRTSTKLPWSWQETEIQQFDQHTNYPKKERLSPPSPKYEFTLGKNDVGASKFRPFSHISAAFKKAPAAQKAPQKGVKFALPSPSISADAALITPSLHQSDLAQLSQIENLCLAMQQSMRIAVHNRNCLGYLSCDGRQALAIFLPPVPQPRPKQYNVTSLAKMLSSEGSMQTQLIVMSGNLRLSTQGRRKLALTVASSVLQLHDTPWLREDWNKHDIQVLEDGGAEVHKWAFVSQTFPVPTAIESARQKSESPVILNGMIFALGIVLIELCLGRAFESFRNPQDPLGANGEANSITDWCTAQRLLEDVYREAGNRYGDAVRRCIRCDFDQRRTTLEDDAFRQAVFDGVVTPLQEIVEDFN